MTSSETNGAQRGAVGAGAEERVATVVGDRLCVRCGFNLFGQLIVREPRYGLVIVRCPECATVAALQEYPSLGKWANRWATLLGGLWLLVMIAGGLAMAGAITGFSVGGASAGADRYQDAIVAAHQRTLDAAGPQPKPTSVFLGGWAQIDPAWWAEQDAAALLRECGGLRGAARNALPVWIPEGFVVFAFGAMISVALLHLRRRWAVLVALAPLCIAAVLCTIAHFGDLAEASHYLSGSIIAQVELGPRLMVVGLAVGAAALVAGAWAGRSIARGLVRVLLPPRLRNAVSRLWIAEGLNPPDGRVARRLQN